MSAAKTEALGLRDRLLVASLVVLSVGNLLVPNAENLAVVAYYLPLSLAVLACLVLLNTPAVLVSPGLPIVVVWTLTFVPGFLTAEGNEYTWYKLLGVLIALVLLIGPLALTSLRQGLLAYGRWLLYLSLAGALVLLFLGAEVSQSRFTFWGLNPIALGRASGFAVVLSFAALIFCFGLRLRSRIFLLAAIVVGITSVIATGSRGPLVATVASATAIVLLAAHDGRLRAGPSLILTGGGAALAAGVSQADIRGLDRFIDYRSSSGRAELLRDSWQVFTDHPLGIGWGRLPEYVQFAGQQEEGRLYAHNIFLEVAVEGGVPALVGLCLLVVIALRWTLASRADLPVASSLVLALLVYLLASAQFSSDIVGNRALWAVLGIALALGARQRARTPPARSAKAWAAA